MHLFYFCARLVFMYQEILKEFGYKVTKPRKIVIDFLVKQKKPVSAQYIFAKIKKNLDKVTVYRVLKVLEEINIVFTERNKKEFLYYIANYQHHHIVCTKCGKSECVPCNHVFNKIKNFNNIKHQLILTGLCNKCNN